MKLGPYTEGQGIVLGGGMAGLLAARVLSDFFRDVHVIERDACMQVQTRKNVPQGKHVHLLLAAGEQILSELFPDISDELERLGGSSSARRR